LDIQAHFEMMSFMEASNNPTVVIAAACVVAVYESL